MQAHDTAAWGGSDWKRADLEEYWGELDLGHDAWVVELEDRIAGYVDFEARPAGRLLADGYVAPDTRGGGVGSALVEAVEARAAHELDRTDGRVFLQYSALSAEDGSADFFHGRGYEDVRHQWRMVIDLAEPPVAATPEGVEIRPYRAGEERAVHAAVEEAWSVGGWLHEPRPYEEWARGTFDRPGHDPALAFVAAAEGELAGVALCDWKRNGDWGWVQTLGVRPAWRRRGIGEALLRAAFAEFFRRDERTVALQVDAQSPTGATRLYERAGMRVLYEIVVRQKELRAG
jgi:ribosomal protein S18 acetylase RimI-like enzyme